MYARLQHFIISTLHRDVLRVSDWPPREFLHFTLDLWTFTVWRQTAV